jgi:hypothetical protein
MLRKPALRIWLDFPTVARNSRASSLSIANVSVANYRESVSLQPPLSEARGQEFSPYEIVPNPHIYLKSDGHARRRQSIVPAERAMSGATHWS